MRRSSAGAPTGLAEDTVVMGESAARRATLFTILASLFAAALWAGQKPGGPAYDLQQMTVDGVGFGLTISQVEAVWGKASVLGDSKLMSFPATGFYSNNYAQHTDTGGRYLSGRKLAHAGHTLFEARRCRVNDVIRLLGPGEESKGFRNRLIYRDHGAQLPRRSLIVDFDHNEEITTNYTVTGFELFEGPGTDDL